jgi:hypothetical protein
MLVPTAISEVQLPIRRKHDIADDCHSNPARQANKAQANPELPLSKGAFKVVLFVVLSSRGLGSCCELATRSL